MLRAMIKLARPSDWLKNVFILAPMPFALADPHSHAEFHPLAFFAGLGAFCLLSSGIYGMNDIFDAEADRLHPKKKLRPVASGAVPIRVAWAQTVVLIAGGLGLCGLCWSCGRTWLPLLGVTYFATNIWYSVQAKHLTLLDVFLIGSGFVLRVLVGCALVLATPSEWLLLCSGALALFLAFAKRRADLAAGLDAHHRPSLAGYSLTFLDQALTITAGLALVSYAIYSRETTVFAPGWKLLSLPFVAYAILDYLRLAQTTGAGGSPTDVLRKSLAIQVCCLGWITAVFFSLQSTP